MTREQLLKDLIGDKALNLQNDRISKNKLKQIPPKKSLGFAKENKPKSATDPALLKNKKNSLTSPPQTRFIHFASPSACSLRHDHPPAPTP
jgi:hypothetical protein